MLSLVIKAVDTISRAPNHYNKAGVMEITRCLARSKVRTCDIVDTLISPIFGCYLFDFVNSDSRDVYFRLKMSKEESLKFAETLTFPKDDYTIPMLSNNVDMSSFRKFVALASK